MSKWVKFDPKQYVRVKKTFKIWQLYTHGVYISFSIINLDLKKKNQNIKSVFCHLCKRSCCCPTNWLNKKTSGPLSHLWRPPEGVTGTVRVVSLGSWGVRIWGMLLGSSPPPPDLSWSESTSSTLTAGRRLRLELSGEDDGTKCLSINEEHHK